MLSPQRPVLRAVRHHGIGRSASMEMAVRFERNTQSICCSTPMKPGRCLKAGLLKAILSGGDMAKGNAFGLGDMEFGWGDHICAVFREPGEQMSIMPRFMAQGLAAFE